MLSRLHLSWLEERWNAYSLSIFYKIMNNMVDVSLPDCITPSHVQNRGHNKNLFLFNHVLMHASLASIPEYFCCGTLYLQTSWMLRLLKNFKIMYINYVTLINYNCTHLCEVLQLLLLIIIIISPDKPGGLRGALLTQRWISNPYLSSIVPSMGPIISVVISHGWQNQL